MDEKALYDAINQVKKEFVDKFDDFRQDMDKKFDRLFAAHDQTRADISELKTHVNYTKEKFEELKGVIDKEVSLIWKELGSQKSDLIHTLNEALHTDRETHLKDVNTCKSICESRITALEKSIKDVDQELDIAKQLNHGRFWKSIAIGLISAVLAFISSIVIRKFF